jgi:hypothetical protein
MCKKYIHYVGCYLSIILFPCWIIFLGKVRARGRQKGFLVKERKKERNIHRQTETYKERKAFTNSGVSFKCPLFICSVNENKYDLLAIPMHSHFHR